MPEWYYVQAVLSHRQPSPGASKSLTVTDDVVMCITVAEGKVVGAGDKIAVVSRLAAMAAQVKPHPSYCFAVCPIVLLCKSGAEYCCGW